MWFEFDQWVRKKLFVPPPLHRYGAVYKFIPPTPSVTTRDFTRYLTSRPSPPHSTNPYGFCLFFNRSPIKSRRTAWEGVEWVADSRGGGVGDVNCTKQKIFALGVGRRRKRAFLKHFFFGFASARFLFTNHKYPTEKKRPAENASLRLLCPQCKFKSIKSIKCHGKITHRKSLVR